MGDRCQAPGCPAGLRRKPSTEDGKLRAGRGGQRRPRPLEERAGAAGSAGSTGSPAAAVWDRAGRRVPPSRGVPSPHSRSPPPPSSSSSAATASCGPPASRRRRVAGEPRRPGLHCGWSCRGVRRNGVSFPCPPPPPALGISITHIPHQRPTWSGGRRRGGRLMLVSAF